MGGYEDVRGEAPPLRRDRRTNNLLTDASAWISKLEDDAHWARTPAIREENMKKARILRDLVELSTRRL